VNFENLLIEYRIRAADRVDAALQSIQDARAELDRIETALIAAAHGEQFTPVRQINGVNPYSVFSAFGAIKTADQLATELADQS
jgi:hypothetical protein